MIALVSYPINYFMNRPSFSKLLFTTFAGIVVLALSGCSDEAPPKPAASVAQQAEPAASEKLISKDSPHDPTPEAELTQKQKFEKAFAAQCADRELNNPANKVEDADRINKACECIAAYVAKDLTDEEAEKFIDEREQPQSLRIKYEAGAYECLQEKAKVEEPRIIKNQQ